MINRFIKVHILLPQIPHTSLLQFFRSIYRANITEILRYITDFG